MDICIHINDSLYCVPKTNNIVNQLYFNKIFKIKLNKNYKKMRKFDELKWDLKKQTNRY